MQHNQPEHSLNAMRGKVVITSEETSAGEDGRDVETESSGSISGLIEIEGEGGVEGVGKIIKGKICS